MNFSAVILLPKCLLSPVQLFVTLAVLNIFLIGPTMAQAAPAGNTGAEAAHLAAQLATGQRIYREGLDGSAEPLKAQGAAQVILTGKVVACAACHRRSGFGANEGQFAVRSIAGPSLFDEQTALVRGPRVKTQLGTRQRPPYTDALLARAIRGGIDSSGKPMEAVMPRYALNDDDMKALAAYLATLGAQPSPGVDEREIHFATVIQPGVAPERRRAMLDIMRAFFKDKGANVRLEEQRRDAGNMRMDRSYRKWMLHVWELTGPSETWNAQLETFYRQQPVFALIGGLGNSSWRPIHEFSEKFEIPSVFPQVDLPLVTGTNNYNFYFSRGVTLEAEVLAKFLLEKGDPGKVIQVYRRDEIGSVAAASFRAALPAGTVVEDKILEGPADEVFWRGVSAAKPAAAVLWLGAQDIGTAQALDSSESLAVYLSFDALGGKLPTAAAKTGSNVRVVYPTDLPPKHEARLLRTKVWLHNKGIPIVDEAVQINTQFSMTVLSDAVGHIMDSFSRDYFVERIEHVVGQTPTPSLYQSVSLGPGQRFAAKGSSIVQMGAGEKGQLKPLSAWIVP
jgi:cytochrome c553